MAIITTMTSKVKNFLILLVLFFATQVPLLWANDDWPVKLSSGDKKLVTYRFELQNKYGLFKSQVHLANHELAFATKIEEIIKKFGPSVFEYFRYVPRDDVHFVIDSSATLSNGSATVFPRNLINLHLVPAVGDEHLSTNFNYHAGLVIHELAHVIHLEQTRNVLRGIENIFGTFGRVATGLTPRWFSEGVATWVESKFLPGGRVESELLNFEFDRTIQHKNFCRKIDCLDNPGVYPNRQFPYWAGSLFLSYLENLKEGTIRCLVLKNSEEVPFVLNAAFRRCLGKYADQLFSDFLIQRIAKLDKNEAMAKEDYTNISKISIGWNEIQLQNGIEVIGDNFYFIHSEKDQVILNEINLKTGVRKILGSDYYWGQIQPSSKNRPRLIIERNSFLSDEVSKEYMEYGGQRGPIPIRTKKHYQYFMKSGRTSVSLDFSQGQWHLFRNEEHLLVLPRSEGLTYPMLVDARNLIYYSHRSDLQENSFRIKHIDLRTKKRKVLFEAERPFSVLGTCDEGLALKYSEGVMLVGVSEQQFFQGKKIAPIVKIEGNSKKTLWFSNFDTNHAYLKKTSCAKTLAFLALKASGVEKTVEKVESRPIEKEVPMEQVSTYPSVSLFRPHYWLLLSSYGTDNLNYFSAVTSVNDPKDSHKLGLQLDYYPNISEYATNANYIYGYHDFGLSVYTAKSYSQSNSQKAGHDQRSSTGLGIHYSNEWKRFNFSSSLTGSQIVAEDFFSKVEGREYSFNQTIVFNPLRKISLLKSALLSGRIFKTFNDNGSDYLGHEGLLSLLSHPIQRFWFNFRTSFGKLEKNIFRDGIITGGGYRSSIHQSYALEYSEMFGNEIFATRAGVDVLFTKLYSGINMMPIFVKEGLFMAGVEHISADFIYINEKFEFRSYVNTIFGGLKYTLDLFYHLPIVAEFVYTITESKQGQKKNAYMSFIKGEFSF